MLFGHERAQLVVIKREEHAKKVSDKKKASKTDAAQLFAAPSPDMSYDELLFEELRKVRKQLADRQAIPPYIVLSDKTLKQLCAQKPTTLEEFGEISGIGEFKKAHYGKDFTEAIRMFLKKGAS